MAIESPGTPLFGVLRPLDVVLAWAQSVLPARRETPAVTESAMRHAVLHHPRYREKSGPISHRHGDLRVGTLRKIYGHSFAAGQSLDTTLYELLELPGSHNVSDLHEPPRASAKSPQMRGCRDRV